MVKTRKKRVKPNKTKLRNKPKTYQKTRKRKSPKSPKSPKSSKSSKITNDKPESGIVKNRLCPEGTTFNDCELIILRHAVDKAETIRGKTKLENETIKTIIHIVEEFLIRKKNICYGGTAINNILPKQEQFYRKDIEFPDYDFFSPNALEDAKLLADIYYKKGFREVEAKSGMHEGTYKVFVNFIPVADITYMNRTIYTAIKNECIVKSGILYAPPNFLRMSMYLELSRPMGDTSRWEKVLKRIRLLNKHFPLKGIKCDQIDIQRKFENSNLSSLDIFHLVKNKLIQKNVVFFGAMANRTYGRYMSNQVKNKLQTIPDFSVLSSSPQITIRDVESTLNSNGFKSTKIITHKPIGELISTHYELKVGIDTILFVFEPIACHSYNTISIEKQKLRIATIDTMLSFYLAFLYSRRPYFEVNRILCMCEFLFKVQQKNRLAQKGLLKRFSTSCIGKQKSIEEMRGERSDLYIKLRKDKTSKMYEKAFLRYLPDESRR